MDWVLNQTYYVVHKSEIFLFVCTSKFRGKLTKIKKAIDALDVSLNENALVDTSLRI